MGSHLFPLTPALSLGERENRPPLRGESNSLSRAGVSVLNRGAHGACVAEFIGSWQAHWCFERGFPLTQALSLGERENRPPRFWQSRTPRLVAARGAVFPLPAGEGQGEGERDAANPNGGECVAGLECLLAVLASVWRIHQYASECSAGLFGVH